MTRRTRHATAAQGDDTYPSILNQGYLSEYYLAYRLRDGLADLYRRWDEREKAGEPTARTSLRGLGVAFSRLRADAASTGVERSSGDGAELMAEVDEAPIVVESLPKDAVTAQQQLNAAVLTGLRWDPEESEIVMMVGDTAVSVPVIGRRDTASGLLLVALGAVFATDPSTVVASKNAPSGTLLSPLLIGDRVVARTVLEAAQLIFTADQPPAYVLVVSGGSVTLLDRERWGEGVFIGANLDDAIARGDDRSKGELASLAALFSADAIDPGDGAQSVLATLLDRSTNESAGVSKELRHGMRRSVELLAAAVVDDIRTRLKKRWEDIDADEMTRQCLRYLYRIIVLLFAEARPELAILPVDDSDYQAGYSVSRLREIALIDLHSELSANSTHIQQSLDVLFALVNDGYQPDNQLDDTHSIVFPGLKSALFGPDACPMLDRANLPDPILQKVLANLCFSRERAGKQRQSLSYATLGINQLGAVYEGLMAYRGFLATEPLYEVDNDGDADTGTWVIPVSKADDFAADVFVTEPGPDGTPRRVTYDVGDFVFRLAGRDRQRSASYYTPEVLTEFTVRHALDVYEEEHPDLTAADWLALTVCEPALGSGAFANEAINQLAVRYLRAAQRERGEQIDPDQYQFELQRTKAHFAINRTYGVDLNRTAVELAEVSLWLNVMHDGLSAPRFDARLRRGNSLIGVRRATYTKEQVADAPWKESRDNSVVSPTDQPISAQPLGTVTGIHHFLLPGEGWGCAADAIELKGKGGANPQPGLAEEWSEQVREWRKKILAKPTKQQVNRLDALSQRVEHAWVQAAKDVTAHLAAHERRIDVWGASDDSLPPADPLRGSTEFLYQDGPTARLRLLMDAWCALWMWSPANGTSLPSLDTWIECIELLLGQPTLEESGQLFSPYELQDGTLESVELFGKASITEINERHPWLIECQRISTLQAFFHWELEFAPVFARGGFDIQVGNPPWVRPTWDEFAALAEHDPWWIVCDQKATASAVMKARRKELLDNAGVKEAVSSECSEFRALNELLTCSSREPHLSGLQANLYQNFMTLGYRNRSPHGVIAMIHPDSHFEAPEAHASRILCYAHLRRHWHFSNAARVFPDISDRRKFAVHVSASRQDIPRFLQAASIFHPVVIDLSLAHNGEGSPPARQDEFGERSFRPHKSRIYSVGAEAFAEWRALLGLSEKSKSVPLLRPLTGIDAEALGRISQGLQVGGVVREYAAGLPETNLRQTGMIQWLSAVPKSIEDLVIHGPNLTRFNAYGQNARSKVLSNNDYDPVDFDEIDARYLPRTPYQICEGHEDRFRSLTSSFPNTAGTEVVLAARGMLDAEQSRSLHVALLPAQARTTGSLFQFRCKDPKGTMALLGQLGSIFLDFILKTTQFPNLTEKVLYSLPISRIHASLLDPLLLRVAVLSCITADFRHAWDATASAVWLTDHYLGTNLPYIPSQSLEWDQKSVARSDFARWQAEVEIDAICGLSFGLEVETAHQIYRSEFDRLRRFEFFSVFDHKGQRISQIHHHFGAQQAKWEADMKSKKVARGEKKVGMWDRVQAYIGGDTTVDLGPFVPPFVPADREGAMSKAYRAFEQRMNES